MSVWWYIPAPPPAVHVECLIDADESSGLQLVLKGGINSQVAPAHCQHQGSCHHRPEHDNRDTLHKLLSCRMVSTGVIHGTLMTRDSTSTHSQYQVRCWSWATAVKSDSMQLHCQGKLAKVVCFQHCLHTCSLSLSSRLSTQHFSVPARVRLFMSINLSKSGSTVELRF